MKLFPRIIFVAFISSNSFATSVQDVSPQRGRSITPINWIDESGRVRRLSEFAGFPIILLPIYTRCPGACIANVDQLKTMLAESSMDPRQFRVLLFSFDATDTPAKLASYRTREKIPLAWFVGSSSQQSIDALLESIGFQYGRAGTEFVHPNLLFVLDSNLRIATWIYGTDYTARDLDRAFKVASGEGDWVGQHSEWVYALLLFAGSLLCVTLVYYVAQLIGLRHATRQAQVAVATNVVER